MFYDGYAVHEDVLSAVRDSEIYLLNRHAQIVRESTITLKVKLKMRAGQSRGVGVAIKAAL